MMFQMLQVIGQYSGAANEDPHLHLRQFLELESNFNIPGISDDVFSGGALLSMSYEDSYKFIEIINANTYQWPVTKASIVSTHKKPYGFHEVSETTTLAAQASQIHHGEKLNDKL
ncbi:hypothetical protein KIW84_014225 [Lathyrus oleraceus]|uniref:Uncharacterized protein n=1 Tax=Pisum sativum TaxID=3888 RepID=A0A9D5GZ90_PEA|nr:hypothetical protein KIW84_014225 [Pisum sativum]